MSTEPKNTDRKLSRAVPAPATGRTGSAGKTSRTPSIAAGLLNSPVTAPTAPPPLTATQRFLQTLEAEHIVEALTHEIIEKACDLHIDRVYSQIAVDYTAYSLWAEMVAVVKRNVVPYDAVVHVDPVVTEVARIPTEDHSRRALETRKRAADDKNLSATGGARRRLVRRGDDNRPTSATSTVDEATIRTLLGGRSSSMRKNGGGLGDSRKGSVSDFDASSTSRNNPIRPAGKRKVQTKGNNLDATIAPTSDANKEAVQSLQQHEYLGDEQEVEEHRARLLKAAADKEESLKKASKIAKVLSDPKTGAKNFTIDRQGNVILVHSAEEGNRGSAGDNSPRFQMIQPAAPVAVAEAVPVKKGGRGKQEGGKKRGEGASKDDPYVTMDARDVPMTIRVAPVGGVTVKDGTPGNNKSAELKLPASKMSKAEFLKARGVVTADLTNVTEGVTLTTEKAQQQQQQEELQQQQQGALPLAKKPQPPNAPKKDAQTAKAGGKGAEEAVMRVKPQAPAPPPQRDVRNAAPRTVGKSTKLHDNQKFELASTWQGTPQQVQTSRVVSHRAIGGEPEDLYETI